jgi:hypothetical protein
VTLAGSPATEGTIKTTTIMAIRSFKLNEPSIPGLHYTATVETDGDYEPMDEVAFTADRRLYTLKYKAVNGAFPRSDTWDMDIVFTNSREARSIEYGIVDDIGTDIHDHQEKPPVKDGM